MRGFSSGMKWTSGAWCIGLTFAFVACSSSSSGGSGATADSGASPADAGSSTTDASTPDDASAASDAALAYPAFKPAMPQLQKGTLTPIAKPVVVNVYFNGETLQSSLDDATNKWIGSSYFTDAVKEYGVTSGSMGTSIALTEDAAAAPTSDDIETWLKGKLDGTHPEFGAVDATTLASKVFVLYYPASSTITIQGVKSCDISGYHEGVTLASGAVANYVVLARCAPPAPLSMTQGLTTTATALVVSAATNPIPSQTPTAAGYSFFDKEHAAYNATNAEVGTACDVAYQRGVTPPDLGVMISRTWSNAAALAYHDPCIPVPDTQPYFVAAAVSTDDVTLQGVVTKGVKVPKGGSAKIALELFSDAPTSGPWTVTAVAEQPGYELSVTPTSSGENGDVLELTIKDTGATGPSQFMVRSDLGMRHTYWLGLASVN